jgi:septum formation protein
VSRKDGRPARRGGLWTLPPGRLVLVSSSPRRRSLLAEQGLRFLTLTPRVDEKARGEAAPVLARRLALEKARWGQRHRPKDWCLGADTLVALGKRVLGKPRSPAEARRMLAALSGRIHVVYTAVALVGPGFRGTRVVATQVRVRKLTTGDIAEYVRTGEPLDKAGAYAAQGKGAVLVAAVEGDWTNVVGLPLGATRSLLARAAARGSLTRKSVP